jgi:hypothetical protein
MSTHAPFTSLARFRVVPVAEETVPLRLIGMVKYVTFELFEVIVNAATKTLPEFAVNLTAGFESGAGSAFCATGTMVIFVDWLTAPAGNENVSAVLESTVTFVWDGADGATSTIPLVVFVPVVVVVVLEEPPPPPPPHALKSVNERINIGAIKKYFFINPPNAS